MKSYNDLDFMNELDAASSMRPATPAVLMFFAVVSLMILLIVWADIAKVEEITKGQGQVVPTQDVQIIQSLEGGIIAELLVKEGETVTAGDVLMRLSDVQFSSEERGTEARFLSLAAKKARLVSEANGTEFAVPAEISDKTPQIAENEKALYESRQKELKNAYAILDDKISQASAELSQVKAEINTLYNNRKHLQEELTLTKNLVAQRAVPKLEQMRLERELSDVSGRINSNAQRRKALEAEVEQARKERSAQDDKFRSIALGELNEVEAQIAGLKENLKSIGDRVSRRELRAPVDGVVNNIVVTTIGGVVEPAMPLVEIVPLDDELKIVAHVSPQDIAFIHKGLPAKVKVSAYDPQKYGALEGVLTRIGANSMTDREGNPSFEIEVLTEKNYLGTEEHPLPITPGMVASVDVITGKRSILEYLLKPILKARDNAFRER